MAGYAVSSRLRGSTPYLAGGTSGGRNGDDIGPVDDLAAWLGGVAARQADQAAADRVELVGRPLDEELRDWLGSIGESWSQLTFYLFDPQSWR